MSINPTCRPPSLPEFFGKCPPRPYDFLEEGGKVLASLEMLSKGGEANETCNPNTGVNPALISTPFWTPTRKVYACAGAAAIAFAIYLCYRQSQSTDVRKVHNVNLSEANPCIEAAKKEYAAQKDLEKLERDP